MSTERIIVDEKVQMRSQEIRNQSTGSACGDPRKGESSLVPCWNAYGGSVAAL